MAKVEVDYDACEANALCARPIGRGAGGSRRRTGGKDAVPLLQVDDPTVTAENRARVTQAVAACPKSALRIVEDA